MADLPLPMTIRQWMRDRQWGVHHLEWHTIRRWDRLTPQERAEATANGWQRAARQEGEPINGFDFLIMHRAMLQLLRQAFPGDASLFDGWKTPPTNPDDPSDPVTAGNPRPFRPAMANAIARLTDGIDTFTDDDDLGLFIETSLRPTPTNPFRTSTDPTTGIHNYLHNRFSDPSSAIDMGDPTRNIENARFWRLHGWIDARWTAFRQAKGLSDRDPAYVHALQSEMDHLSMRAMHPMNLVAAARARLGATAAFSASLRSPFRETVAQRFNRLMSSVQEIDTIEDLRDYVQTAIALEQATLPLYLTAAWSIKGTSPSDLAIVRIIMTIAFQEMVHMGLACNLLKAIGGSPRINTHDAVVQFPDYLPGVDLGEKVDLRPISTDRVKLFMEIEKPLNPIPPALLTAAVPRYPTIGEFYAAIRRGLAKVDPHFDTAGQLTRNVRGNKITVIANQTDAQNAVKLIQEQGEGTTTSQGATDFGGGLAHYYQFQQIDRQMRYKLVPGTTQYKLDPASPLPFPAAAEIYPMAPVPCGGYPNVPEAVAFDQLYSTMLGQLQKAWDGGDAEALEEAVNSMLGLQDAAVAIMSLPSSTYGPAFQLVQVSAPGPTASAITASPADIRPVPRKVPSPPNRMTAASPEPDTPTVTYARVRQLLDEAVHGNNIGAHGPFWRTLTRDQFVAKSVFGKPLIAKKTDGTFDPDESNLVKALEGRSPFGADLDPPPAGAFLNRMPDGYDPMPQVRINEIRAWIGEGCPATADTPAAFMASTAGSPLPDQTMLDFWRELDNWAMFEATPEVSNAINVFFDKAPLWMVFASDETREPDWQAATLDGSFRDAVALLEGRQRQTVLKYFGRPVPIESLLYAFRRFGDNSLPNDTQRPADMRHTMNGRVMWFMWSAFCDACLRLATPQGIPASFWYGMTRGILVGLMNDGLIRGRFTVNGFPATAVGQDALEQYVAGLADNELAGETRRRFRDSGLPVPA
jgi:hypothetical protein